MLKGSCLCEGVQYEYDGEINEIAICHCNQCKRAQGTPFVTNAPVESDRLHFFKGENLIRIYYSTPNKQRAFCGNCGSPLYSRLLDRPEITRLRVGSITEGAIPHPHYHIYYDSHSDWFEMTDILPCYAAGKPD